MELKNWDDWFAMCGPLSADMKAYEDLMHKYYFDIQSTKTEESRQQAQMAYQGRHNKRFFDSEPMLPKWMIRPIIFGGLIAVGFGLILALAWAFLTARRIGVSFPAYLTNGEARSWLLYRGSILAALFVLFALGGQILLYNLRTQSLFQKMRTLEVKLEPRVRYIPPKYRNSQAVGVFYDLYCSYGIVSFNQAITTCDDYLVKNNLIGAYMAILFDVPYEAALSGDTGGNMDRGLSMGGNTDDPALPDDIRAKTFSGVDDADARLNELVGLEQVKAQVRQMKNRMNFYGDSGNAERISGNHMVFLGPPGTGKTTIARIITKILYDFGYIKENRCVEIDGGYLKSPYAGQTTERTNAILRYALGGVLFIDEAYILTEDKNNAQGAEAVGVLLKALEDYRNDFVCIMAGYEDNMNRMLSSNEGFASRIKYKIYFENFTVDELGMIFRGMMRTSAAHRYKIDKEAFETLKQHFAQEQQIPGFGNARVVRNAWDAILDIHADRYMRGELSEELKFTITKDDVSLYITDRQKQMTEDGRNFIARHNLDSSIISLAELKQKTKPGATDPDAALQALTGLSVVKDEIARMKAQFAFYDGKMENTGNHMVFLGPPGTGKTTVASIMTGYLYQMGLIRENSYLDINGDFLRGMYLGHTGKRTEAVVQYAQGMALFIDEAYLLVSQDGTSDQFGQEAVGVLLDAMEKYRSNFVVIFAGYDKEMNNFLNMNSGLRSRISLEFHFQSYTPHELARMMRDIAKSNGFTVEKDVWIPLQQYFKMQATNPRFGNGRFVRQLFEAMKKQHIVNFADGMYPEDKKFVIQSADLNAAVAEKSEMSIGAD